ncbi:MAG: hypothetical protein ACR2KV_02580, partial [Solirubrobacteraceae bacterium]
AMQRSLGDALSAHEGEGWTYDSLERQDAGGSYDGAGGYPSLVPLVLVRRGGEDLRRAVQQALAERPAPERRRLDRLTGGWKWKIGEVGIDIFEFGAGIVRCTCAVQPPASLGPHEIRRTIDLLSRLNPTLATASSRRSRQPWRPSPARASRG